MRFSPSSPVPAPYDSDAFLAAIVNSSADAILTKDLKGVITSWNASAGRIFGYTAEEAIGQPVTLLFPRDRYDEEPTILARIQRGEEVGHYETVRRRKDGTLINISLTVSPIRNATGVVIGASKIAREITKQKQEQERFRVTLSSIADAVVSTDAAGVITFMNPVAEGLIGWAKETALGLHIDEVVVLRDEHSRQRVASALPEALPTSRTISSNHQTLLIAKTGEEIAVEKNVAPIQATDRQASGAVLVLRDVRAARAAEIAAARLAAIINGSDDAIVSKNLNGIVTSWNPGAERVFGYTEREMIGHPIVKLLPPDRLNEEQDILARLQRGERVDHFQTIRRRKDGKLIHVSLTISPIRDKKGVVIGASKIARDITILREAHQTLESHARELEMKVRERTKKLEETVAELESFSYSLSHDMRAPLRAIHSFTEIALEDHGDHLGEGKEHLLRVISAAARMDRLILDVLSFTRVSRSDITVGRLDVEHLVKDIIAERPELQRGQAEVIVDGPLLSVVGHDASLTQCLTNLMDNAVKFKREGVRAEVHISTELAGDDVRICVTDNGIGIEPEAQQRLFSLFQRLPNAEKYDGTGIGLAIVRKAAERMNGSAGVRSLVGQGSTFWIQLPKA